MFSSGMRGNALILTEYFDDTNDTNDYTDTTNDYTDTTNDYTDTTNFIDDSTPTSEDNNIIIENTTPSLTTELNTDNSNSTDNSMLVDRMKVMLFR